MTCLVMRTPNGELPRISPASASAASSSSSPSTIRLTSPVRAASAASTNRPVSIHSAAALMPTRRGRW